MTASPRLCPNCSIPPEASEFCPMCGRRVPQTDEYRHQLRIEIRAEALYNRDHGMRAPAGFAHFYPSFQSVNLGTRRDYLARAEQELGPFTPAPEPLVSDDEPKPWSDLRPAVRDTGYREQHPHNG